MGLTYVGCTTANLAASPGQSESSSTLVIWWWKSREEEEVVEGKGQG